MLNNKFGLISIIIIFLSLILTILSFNFAIEFSAFGVGILKASIAIGLFWLFDFYGLRSIDTIEELKKGNIAYALFLLALAVLVGFSISSS